MTLILGKANFGEAPKLPHTFGNTGKGLSYDHHIMLKYFDSLLNKNQKEHSYFQKN